MASSSNRLLVAWNGIFANQYLPRVSKTSIDTFIEDKQPVVLEKNRFEFRYKSISEAVLAPAVHKTCNAISLGKSIVMKWLLAASKLWIETLMEEFQLVFLEDNDLLYNEASYL